VLGPIDRLLGFGFGAVKGFIIVVLGFSILVFGYDVVWGVSGRPMWISQARTYPFLNAASEELMTMIADRRAAAEADAKADEAAKAKKDKAAAHKKRPRSRLHAIGPTRPPIRKTEPWPVPRALYTPAMLAAAAGLANWPWDEACPCGRGALAQLRQHDRAGAADGCRWHDQRAGPATARLRGRAGGGLRFRRSRDRRAMPLPSRRAMRWPHGWRAMARCRIGRVST
jgi:hypothetical protein